MMEGALGFSDEPLSGSDYATLLTVAAHAHRRRELLEKWCEPP